MVFNLNILEIQELTYNNLYVIQNADDAFIYSSNRDIDTLLKQMSFAMLNENMASKTFVRSLLKEIFF